jgi:hypothetical protein
MYIGSNHDVARCIDPVKSTFKDKISVRRPKLRPKTTGIALDILLDI